MPDPVGGGAGGGLGCLDSQRAPQGNPLSPAGRGLGGGGSEVAEFSPKPNPLTLPSPRWGEGIQAHKAQYQSLAFDRSLFR